MSVDIESLVEQVIGAAIEVHRHFGAGFQELTYQRALAVELNLRGLPFEQEVPVQLRYKQEVVGEGRIDLLIGHRLVVELKACEGKPERFRRQVVSYLKAMDLPLGLVINFNCELLKDGLARVSNTS